LVAALLADHTMLARLNIYVVKTNFLLHILAFSGTLKNQANQQISIATNSGASNQTKNLHITHV